MVFPSTMGATICPSPERKTAKLASVELPPETVISSPTAYGPAPTVSVGKAETGRAGLVAGQPVKKGAASE